MVATFTVTIASGEYRAPKLVRVGSFRYLVHQTDDAAPTLSISLLVGHEAETHTKLHRVRQLPMCEPAAADEIKAFDVPEVATTQEFALELGRSSRILPHDYCSSPGAVATEVHIFSFPGAALRGTKRKRPLALEEVCDFELPLKSLSLEVGLCDPETTKPTLLVAQGDRIVEFLLDGTELRHIQVPFIVRRFIHTRAGYGHQEGLVLAVAESGYRVFSYNMRSGETNQGTWSNLPLLSAAGYFGAIEDDGMYVQMVTDEGFVARTSYSLAGLSFSQTSTLDQA